MSVRSAARPTCAAQSTSRPKTPASSQACACGFDTTLSMGIIAMKNHQRHLLAAGIAIGVLAIGIGGFVWSGLYNIGSDDPHWAPTRMLIDNLREHSIGARMADVAVPTQIGRASGRERMGKDG